MRYSAIINTACLNPANQSRIVFLKQALASVLKQTLAPQEIILVVERPREWAYHKSVDLRQRASRQKNLLNNFPKDIQEIILKHRVKLIANLGSGISSSRNSAIKLSCAPWLAFLDDDDEWLPRKIEKQANIITKLNKQGENPLLCHTDEKWLRNGKYLNPHLKHKKNGGYIYANCLNLCCISPSTTFISRKVFATYGLFDEKMPVCEDYDMWLRVCAYEKIAFLDKKLAIKKGGHPDQLSHKYWGMDRFRCYALTKILEDPKLNDKYRQATKENLVKRWQILALGAAKRHKNNHLKYYQSHIKRLQTINA